MIFFKGVAELTDNGLSALVCDDVVAIKNCKRLISNEVARFCNRVRKAVGLLLAQEVDVCHMYRFKNFVIDFLFGRVVFEVGLKLKGMVKVVLNGALSAVGDDENFFNTCLNGFLNNILDCGLVNNVEHLFRNGL